MKQLTHKKMREMYPYALDGHKKNCTCFSCGNARYDLLELYEPELAQALYDAREKKWDETVAMAKEQNHNTELKMTRVLRGNKSYKELDTSSYYSFVEYKIVDAPVPCYTHPSWDYPNGCDCDRPMHKVKEVSNPKELEFLKEKDTVHCSSCFQRLGNACMPCPLCVSSGRVFGKMLKNPTDRRWTLPRYSGKPDKNTVHIRDLELKARQSDMGNKEDLK